MLIAPLYFQCQKSVTGPRGSAGAIATGFLAIPGIRALSQALVRFVFSGYFNLMKVPDNAAHFRDDSGASLV
jgi:hypothetical protein